MKNIYVSMPIKEEVLDSYLLRVFKGKLITKKSCKVVYFPEKTLLSKAEWTKKKFKSFCEMTISQDSGLRIYKAERKS